MSVTHLHLAKQSARLAVLGLVLGALPGCQSIAGNAVVSQVRIIDTSPDAPGLDIYEGSGVLAYNLGFGTATSYVPITPGSYAISADVANSKQQLISARGSFNVNNEYTVLIGNYVAGLTETVLQDQSTPAPSGQVALRFLDQSPAAGTLDLYLVSSSGTLLTSKPVLYNVAFGSNSGYVNVSAGTYTLVALPAGTVATSTTVATYLGTAVTYTGGSVRTLVLINQPLATTPGLQVITAADYDSAGAT
ncbi:protein of unknown function [Granulicella rosea]|uniref:DUF4397 domain-containing protein n=1 Tax=Granulicella rosea TaxID=474952 RepID=A0A239JQW6_9BACT|nr:DUF4397 domain-containing protein [Granulicella rosea]SNT08139.1 protein of unknown function [Granulicella rosea]